MTNLITILVLAGGDFKSKTLGPTPPLWSHPLLLPAGSKLAIEIIRRFYEKGPLQSIFKAVVDDCLPADVPIRYIEEKDLIHIPPQPNIISTLKESLKAVTTPWVLINPITTLPSRSAELTTQVMVGERQLIRENWSSMRASPNGGWIFEKKSEAANNKLSAPFTGILCAPTEILSRLTSNITDNQADDLISLAEALTKQVGSSVIRTQWHDLGHQATHAASRRSNFSSRVFNKVEHCHQRDVIVKSSKDQARLAAERKYIEALPQPLQRHFPALIPSKAEEATALVMEAVPFPSLAELHLHWDLGPNIWLAILDRLKNIQLDFIGAAPTHIGSSSWLYSEKLKTRWNQFLKDNNNEQWWKRELCINGQWFSSLEDQILGAINNLESIEAESKLHLIHGDFCFNNILCDPLYTAIRLIDPRGETDTKKIYPPGYGDSRYDLVKLFHSIGGHYDSIVNNLFKLQWQSSTELNLDLYIPNHQPFLAGAFQDIFMPAELSKQELYVLTASLFFSMLPLHSEDLERQLALAASGIFLLNHQGA